VSDLKRKRLFLMATCFFLFCCKTMEDLCKISMRESEKRFFFGLWLGCYSCGLGVNGDAV